MPTIRFALSGYNPDGSNARDRIEPARERTSGARPQVRVSVRGSGISCISLLTCKYPMYIHRVVIDANRINAQGKIPAMTALEAMDAAGVVEIFQTSTMSVEMKPYVAGKQKSAKYTKIGGNELVYTTADSNVADTQLGACGRESRLDEIHRIIFEE